MRTVSTAFVMVCMLVLVGCVAQGEHKKALADLEQTKGEFAAEQERAASEETDLTARIGTLEQDNATLSNRLLEAQSAGGRQQARLEAIQKSLDGEQRGRREAEQALEGLQDRHQQTVRLGEELRRERDGLRNTSEDLRRQLETSNHDLENVSNALGQADAHIAQLDRDKAQVEAALAQADNRARDLEILLAAERENVARVSEEKQRLLSGTTTAQEEIARLQRQAGKLEARASQVSDLEERLSERDREIGQLRQAAADRHSLARKLVSLGDELVSNKARVVALTEELASVSEQAAAAEQERDKLTSQAGQLEAEVSRKSSEIELLRLAQQDLARSLENERADKEVEVRRFTRTQEALNESLRAEIAKGDIRIQQVADRLTINMVDRVLFDSGRAQLKPAGIEVLGRVSEVLKNITDKQIRIEGHTDDVPIGAKLQQQFPTNWELSTARATSVVRYLVEKGGVDSTHLTAAGHADTQPVASNNTEKGRQANRRIEIVLYPKDLSGIVEEVQS